MKSIFSNKCPWCSQNVNVIAGILQKRSIVQCKSCKKYHEIDNFISSFTISVVVLITAATISKKIFILYSDSIVKLILSVLVILIWIFTFSKFVRLRKYKY